MIFKTAIKPLLLCVFSIQCIPFGIFKVEYILSKKQLNKTFLRNNRDKMQLKKRLKF